jgi:protein gp37
MANRGTNIEWTEWTWNPFVGCDIVSPGCRNCYAMRMAHRIASFPNPHYAGTTQQAKRGPVWTGKLSRNSDAAMRKPLGIRQPSLIFVNSMSDFWHPAAEDAWRAEALAIMRATPQHEYQVLTKRPELISPTLARMGETLPGNFWLGATVEDAKHAWRIDELRAVPAVIRFLSVEPLIAPLGPVDLTGIDWVIVGGESGPNFRPMDPAWARAVRDQCRAQGVALFVKQMSGRGAALKAIPRDLKIRQWPRLPARQAA